MWIWYPGEFELWLSIQVQDRRRFRGEPVERCWHINPPFTEVTFQKEVGLHSPESIQIQSTGTYTVTLDGAVWEDTVIPAGRHLLCITAKSQTLIPAIAVTGDTIVSDSGWLASGGGEIVSAAQGEACPDGFPLAIREIEPVHRNGTVYDFGRETFGYLKVWGIRGSGRLKICYGESLEEAMDEENCEKMDVFDVEAGDFTSSHSEAMRYVSLIPDGVTFDGVTLLFEYLPVEYRGSFRCSDALLNRIWDVSLDTFHLTTREFFLDGIKRDRWVWGGDTYQSCLMNYYTFFDNAVCRRTLTALRGKEPFTQHINTILDYSFYWVISLYDYYLYTGDAAYIASIFDKLERHMAFCLSRRSDDGLFVRGLPGDWVFVDWADMKLDTVVCAEQVLLLRSLECMAQLCRVTKLGDADRYQQLFDALYPVVFERFWDDAEGLRHCDVPHRPTKYANIFAVMYEYLTEEQKKCVLKNSLQNEAALQIVTPYAKFYEMESLLKCGQFQCVLDEIRRYWGGMLALGATSFWEQFNPEETVPDVYGMYGRKYGKSLCHAWGSSPLYLLGKYFLGVRPTAPGYQQYMIEPNLGDLAYVEGKVPTPLGDICIYYDRNVLKVQGICADGILRFCSCRDMTSDGAERIGENRYQIWLHDDTPLELKLV